MMASKKSKTTHEQYEIIVQYIENHPNLKSNKLTNNFTSKDRSRLWEDLAECLNSVNGPHKDVQKWQKTWTDFKHITLKTARMRRRLLESSGSFTVESFRDELSPLQRRVLKLMGWNETFGSIEEGNFGKESPQSPSSPNEAFFPIVEEHSYSENEEQMDEYEEMDDVEDDSGSNIELFSITKYPDNDGNYRRERREENTVINRLMKQQSEILEKISQQHKQILDAERKDSEREKNCNCASDTVNLLLRQQNKFLEKIASQLERIANAQQAKKEENNSSINVLLQQQNKLLEKIAGHQERIADAEHRKADTLPELSSTIKELLKK